MTLTLARRAIGLAERGIIANAWNNKCAYCKTTDGPFAIDHIVPHAASGTCDVDNLCWACSKCNAQKSDTRLPIFQEGLLLGLAVRRAKGITSKLKAAQTVVKPKVKRKAPKPDLVIGNRWRFLNNIEELGRYVSLVDALLEHGLFEEVGQRSLLPDRIMVISEPVATSFLNERGIYKGGDRDEWPMLSAMYYEDGSRFRNMGVCTTTSIKTGDVEFGFSVSMKQFLSIRNLASNAYTQGMDVA